MSSPGKSQTSARINRRDILDAFIRQRRVLLANASEAVRMNYTTPPESQTDCTLCSDSPSRLSELIPPKFERSTMPPTFKFHSQLVERRGDETYFDQ